MYVARIRPAVIIQFENEIGGYEKTVFIGSPVHIVTRKGVSVSGILKDFSETEDELMQDVLIIETQDELTPIKRVGVNSIESFEVEKDGAWMD
jgi:putative aminopeptidase FrvX